MKYHIFRAFSEKSFLFLWLGEIFTQISINVLNFFLVLLVFTLAKSNFAVSGVVMSFTIPAILFGIIAGVYVDRWSKKEVLIVTNIIRALILIFLGFFHTNLMVIYIASFLITIATQFFIPAETPLIPHLVKDKMLFSANALFGLALYGSILIGYVISGPLILTLGYSNMFFLLSVLLFIGALFISFIKKPTVEVVRSEKLTFQEMKREIREAFSLLAGNRDVYSSLFLLALSQVLLLIVAVIAPGYATQILGIKIEEFPVIFVAPAAFGVLAGAILLTHWFHDFPKSKLINTGLFLSGVAMLIMPFGSRIATKQIVQTVNSLLPPSFAITPIHILVFLAFILGLANAFVFVPANTILLQKTSDNIRGKIYGVLNTTIGLLSLIPIIVVGSLSDIIGIAKVIVGLGVTLLIIAIARVVYKH